MGGHFLENRKIQPQYTGERRGGSPWAALLGQWPLLGTLLGQWPLCTDCDSYSSPALSLFLMAVNIKTPVVVENITLMCLRILQKLIKPPAPTSKKNKVLCH